MRSLVLGATSTLAAEVAARWAAHGDRLHLVGRNADKLDAVARRCAAATVSAAQADFAALERNAGVIDHALAQLGGLDRVLIAHGDIGDQLRSEHDLAEAQRIIVANFTSVVSLLLPLASHLEQARGGTIGVITSVAGERGRPRNYTYGAAKGALNVYLEGLRTRLYGAGVTVTTLKLGPVDTAMTTDHHKHALFGRADKVARDIVAALDAGVAVAYVPSFWRVFMPIIRAVPEPIFQRVPFLSGR